MGIKRKRGTLLDPDSGPEGNTVLWGAIERTLQSKATSPEVRQLWDDQNDRPVKRWLAREEARTTSGGRDDRAYRKYKYYPENDEY